MVSPYVFQKRQRTINFWNWIFKFLWGQSWGQVFQFFASASYIYTYIPGLTSAGGLGPKSKNRPTTWRIIARFPLF
jgi:hypothetical protein